MTKPSKPHAESTHSRKCQRCGKSFILPSKRSARRYCSQDCAYLTRRKPPRITPCENCGVRIDVAHARGPKRYCSVACCSDATRVSVKARMCRMCGISFTPPRRRRKTQEFCSRSCSDAKHRKPRSSCSMCGTQCPSPRSTYCSRKCMALGFVKPGSVMIDSSGYRVVRDPITRKLRREHRVVMERHIGRSLTRSEYVHHRNHDKLDNRIENLEIMTPAAHSRLHNLGRKKSPEECQRLSVAMTKSHARRRAERQRSR